MRTGCCTRYVPESRLFVLVSLAPVGLNRDGLQVLAQRVDPFFLVRRDVPASSLREFLDEPKELFNAPAHGHRGGVSDIHQHTR
jgi:hypothetical protein